MIFSGHATNQDIVSDTRWLISGDPAGVTDYGINDITRNVNRWYDRVVSLIMRADGRWEWDDDNYDTLPVATTNLVSGQPDYNIASSSFLNLIRVEVKDQSSNWILLKPISYEDRKGSAMTEWAETDSTPESYDKVGNSIILYPTSDYSSDSALKVYFQRVPSYFAYDDTTKVAGFAPLFHRILSMGAAYDYCLVNSFPEKRATLKGEIAGMEAQLIAYYSQRSKDEQPRMTLHKEDFGVGGGNSGEPSVGWES